MSNRVCIHNETFWKAGLDALAITDSSLTTVVGSLLGHDAHGVAIARLPQLPHLGPLVPLWIILQHVAPSCRFSFGSLTSTSACDGELCSGFINTVPIEGKWNYQSDKDFAKTLAFYLPVLNNFWSPATIKRPSSIDTPLMQCLAEGKLAASLQELPPSFFKISVEAMSIDASYNPPVTI